VASGLGKFAPMDFLLLSVFVVFGSGFVVWIAGRALLLRLGGTATTATIVELVRHDSGDGVSFIPVVEFTTTTGDTVVAKSFYGTEGAGSYFRVGQQVPIRYLANNPRLFAISGYEASSVLIVFLAAALICGLCYWGAR
jgi:hypothetical protein